MINFSIRNTRLGQQLMDQISGNIPPRHTKEEWEDYQLDMENLISGQYVSRLAVGQPVA